MLAAVRSELTKELVEVKDVEKRLVEVLCVVVELTPVKFCKVEEPETRRSPEVLIEVVALPPTLSSLALKILAKRLVEVAEVVVAKVVVELVKVRLEIWTKEGRDRVQVRLAERS